MLPYVSRQSAIGQAYCLTADHFINPTRTRDRERRHLGLGRLLVIRSRRPFFQSRPGRALLLATVAVGLATSLLPLTPLGAALGFVPLPAPYYGFLFVILGLYVATAELAKRIFYRHIKG